MGDEPTDISTTVLIQAFMTKISTTSKSLALNVDPIGVDRKRILRKVPLKQSWTLHKTSNNCKENKKNITPNMKTIFF